jgi:hypothetical protein
MKGPGKVMGKVAKIPSPDVLEDYINVADKAAPVLQKVGDVAIDLVNKAAPAIENVGNCAFNIIDRGLETVDNAIDKVIDIPFKAIRKAQGLDGGGVKSELKEAIGLIKAPSSLAPSAIYKPFSSLKCNIPDRERLCSACSKSINSCSPQADPSVLRN